MKLKSLLPVLLSLLLLLGACNGDTADPAAPAQSARATVTPSDDEAVATASAEESEAPEPAAATAADATGAAAATPTDEAAPIPLPTATEAIPEPAGKTGDLTVGEVTIPGVDRLTLVGTFQSTGDTSPHPTVLLLHMLGSNREVWVEFAATLNENGYNTLAVDMRGHGETGGDREWSLAADDLILVWQYLAERPDVDETRIAIIGGSIGANMALLTGANLPQINTVALLSPGLDYRGVETAPAMAAYGDRPVLIIASTEDTYSANSSRDLATQALNENSFLHLYSGAGHGTNMFGRAEDLTQRLLDWLAIYL